MPYDFDDNDNPYLLPDHDDVPGDGAPVPAATLPIERLPTAALVDELIRRGVLLMASSEVRRTAAEMAQMRDSGGLSATVSRVVQRNDAYVMQEVCDHSRGIKRTTEIELLTGLRAFRSQVIVLDAKHHPQPQSTQQ